MVANNRTAVYMRVSTADQKPDLQLDDLRAYADSCGPITVHSRNPGTLGYLAGPDVTVIDVLGLTDRYIAKLPKAFLAYRVPRPGHPDKYIPVRYLAGRGDISLLASWKRGRGCR